MSQKLWTIIAHVRKRGAQGIFYDWEFTAFGEDAKAAWFDEWGDSWELHHFVTIKDRKEGNAPHV